MPTSALNHLAPGDRRTPTPLLPGRILPHRVVPWEWLHNVWQAGKRVIIEHAIARMKKYQVLAQVYRHRVRAYGLRVRNIAALV